METKLIRRLIFTISHPPGCDSAPLKTVPPLMGEDVPRAFKHLFTEGKRHHE